MAKGIFNDLHVDRARVRFYDPEDLEFLWKVQRDILEDLIIERSPWAAPKNADHTKARLAVALLECADTGERDEERLKRHALAALDDVTGRTATTVSVRPTFRSGGRQPIDLHTRGGHLNVYRLRSRSALAQASDGRAASDWWLSAGERSPASDRPLRQGKQR